MHLFFCGYADFIQTQWQAPIYGAVAPTNKCKLRIKTHTYRNKIERYDELERIGTEDR